MKLNLGCGNDIKEGYLNMDIQARDGVEYIDLEKRLPFKDNEIDEILLLSVFEHVNNRKQLLKEIERILTSTGKVIIRVPFINTYEVGGDITHKLGFTLDAFRRLESLFNIRLYAVKEEIRPYKLFRLLPKRLIYFLSLYNFPCNMIFQIKVTLSKYYAT